MNQGSAIAGFSKCFLPSPEAGLNLSQTATSLVPTAWPSTYRRFATLANNLPLSRDPVSPMS